MIPDEPVRGHTPPSWLDSLSGLDRLRLFAAGRVPITPSSRLLGTRIGNVAPGSATMRQPAAQALTASNGQLVVTPLLANALGAAASTALEPGMAARALSLTANALRPVRAQPGNLLARARVTNASRLSVFTEAHVEDPEGRAVAHGTLHCAVERIEPPPPDVPATIARVDEPAYGTADPYLRALREEALTLPWGERDGIDVLRTWIDQGATQPINELLGVTFVEVAPGHVRFTVPASPWFCNATSDVSEILVTAFTDVAHWFAAWTSTGAGVRMAGVEETARFYRDTPADGRMLTCDAGARAIDGRRIVTSAILRDADGHTVAESSGSVLVLPADPDAATRGRQSERVLLTMLFTDIVGSTDYVQRTGDAAWDDHLEQYRLSVRREISRFNGVEVDTAGDGFFVRFDTPLRAIEAARAIRATSARHNLKIRAGIHTGECEVRGNTLSGIAVHLASRIQAAAGAGEILVSSTVRDLVSGSGVSFSDCGEHALKGISEPRRLYAVEG